MLDNKNNNKKRQRKKLWPDVYTVHVQLVVSWQNSVLFWQLSYLLAASDKMMVSSWHTDFTQVPASHPMPQEIIINEQHKALMNLSKYLPANEAFRF